MCVAIIKQAGEFGPSDRMIHHLWRKNSDGGGFCVVRGGLVTGFKGFMTEDDFVQNLRSEVKKEDKALIHMRITTHGGTHPGGTHPFPAEQDEAQLNARNWQSRFGIMHNGTFSGYGGTGSYGKKDIDGLSDTQEFISKILYDRILLYSLFSNRNNSAAVELLNTKIGYNRVAIMRFDGSIFTFGDWNEAGGCWYSNLDYKGIGPNNTQKTVRSFKEKKRKEEIEKEKKEEHKQTTAAKEAGNHYGKKEIEEDLKAIDDLTFTAKKYDYVLKRMVPCDPDNGYRLDRLMKCPSCGSYEGTPCIHLNVERCTTCCPEAANQLDLVNSTKSEQAPIILDNAPESCPAMELARPEKKSGKIRKMLLEEHDLHFCKFADAFIPGNVCLTCINCNIDDGEAGSCHKLEELKLDNKQKYNAIMGATKHKDCYPGIESLEEIGLLELSMDYAYDNYVAREEIEKVIGALPKGRV